MDDPENPHALPRQIQHALALGWTVLTANQRAARTLRHAFDLRQRALGLANWQPPAILAWEAWLGSLWHCLLLDGHASDMLLNATQEHTLWRAIITEDGATDGAGQGVAASLRPIDSLAESAGEAWLLLHAYRGRRRLHASTGSSDTRAFERWGDAFDRRCARSHYVSAAQLPEVLRAAVAAGHVTLAPGFLLAGFDRRTPAQTALIDAVEAAGAHLEELRLDSIVDEAGDPPPSSTRTLLAAPDEHQELAAAARWLQTRLTQDATVRLAVIVPEIETGRAEIDRVFRHILTPEIDDIAAPGASGVYEFSLGVPLASTPMVATALDILRWAAGPLALDRVTALLLSPHFAVGGARPSPAATAGDRLERGGESGGEHLARAEFDAFVLRGQHRLRPEISLDDLHSLVAKVNSNPKSNGALDVLADHLRALRPLFRKQELATGERSHADWAAAIHDLLEAAGWADRSRDSSTEFQTRRKWESALDELATLDFDGTRVSFAAALAALERIAQETLFAPQSRHAPIQIMGPLESAGSTFDGLWFLRANDLAWPSTPAPNALLPWPLQRELGMPGTDPARDAAHSRRITERIAASAPKVLFSYAQESADGRQRPSPALAGLLLEARNASDIAPAPTLELDAIRLDRFADDAALPPPLEGILQGGAAVLQLQAACGFRAFAERRLFASGIDSISLGLDSGERGSLVHSVLERFWGQVESQAALSRMSSAERDTVLAQSVDAALAEHNARPGPGWPRAYLDTERQRLLNLLRPWLEYELTRPPFTVKSREEALRDVGIGPLRLSVRVDRIDLAQMASDPDSGRPAGEIILDYKTGPATPSAWLGDRPDAPQLPLYAVVSDTPQLAAIAFANLRPGKEMGLKGYQAYDGVLPKATKLPATESLEAQVEEWRHVLTSLATSFHQGDARVSPKQYPSTCRFCQQRLLCRLDVAALDAGTLDDPDADDVFEASGPEVDRG